MKECCFLWGFNSLFTAVLLVQNPFLEANANQSNLMSAQQGLSCPTVGVSGELHFSTATKRNKAAEATSPPSSHRPQWDVIPPIPCSQARHKTKLTACYCCVFSTLFIDLHHALYLNSLGFWWVGEEKIQAKKQRAHSAAVAVGPVSCRDDIFHPTRPEAVHIEALQFLPNPLHKTSPFAAIIIIYTNNSIKE